MAVIRTDTVNGIVIRVNDGVMADRGSDAERARVNRQRLAAYRIIAGKGVIACGGTNRKS